MTTAENLFEYHLMFYVHVAVWRLVHGNTFMTNNKATNCNTENIYLANKLFNKLHTNTHMGALAHALSRTPQQNIHFKETGSKYNIADQNQLNEIELVLWHTVCWIFVDASILNIFMTIFWAQVAKLNLKEAINGFRKRPKK